VKNRYIHGGYPPLGHKFVKDEKGKPKYVTEESKQKQ